MKATTEQVMEFIKANPRSTYKDIADGVQIKPSAMARMIDQIYRDHGHKAVACFTHHGEWVYADYRDATEQERKQHLSRFTGYKRREKKRVKQPKQVKSTKRRSPEAQAKRSRAKSTRAKASIQKAINKG